MLIISRKHALLIASALYCALASNTVIARTWHIKHDQSGDAPTIEAAIDSSASGDTILVSPGFYVENTLAVVDKDLHIIGEMGALETVVKMEIYYEFNIHVFSLSGLSSNSSISGLTITGGRGSPVDDGAGLSIENSSTLITENIICDNSTQSGGGIACFLGSPTIRKNILYNNRAGMGCAIFVYNSNAVIDSNTIVYNGLDCNGDLACGEGSGLFIDCSTPLIVSNNIIAFNHAASGGGIYCASSTENLSFTCNLLYDNAPNDYEGTLPDQTGMNGNISLDPQFCAVKPDSSINFYLQSDSPCLPENHPQGIECGSIGAWHRGCGITQIKINSWGKIKQLYYERSNENE